MAYWWGCKNKITKWEKWIHVLIFLFLHEYLIHILHRLLKIKERYISKDNGNP